MSYLKARQYYIGIKMELNKVFLCGKLGELTESEDKIYTTVAVLRKSGIYDIIPLIFNINKKSDIDKLFTDTAYVFGKIYTRAAEVSDCNKKIQTFIYVSEVSNNDGSFKENNQVEVIGKVIKEPIYRVTPKGKLLVEIPIKSANSLVQVIAWKDTAVDCKTIHQWDTIYAAGRFQSREYTKHSNIYTTYEMSSVEVHKISDD